MIAKASGSHKGVLFLRVNIKSYNILNVNSQMLWF